MTASITVNLYTRYQAYSRLVFTYSETFRRGFIRIIGLQRHDIKNMKIHIIS